MTTKYIVPEHYLRNVAKYLGTKPYNEVQDLVNELNTFGIYPESCIERMEKSIADLRSRLGTQKVNTVAEPEGCCNSITPESYPMPTEI